MARKPRIEYYGAIYHIIHNGNNKEYIFEDEEDKIYLLKVVGEVKEIYDFSIFAYIIMNNHYHFIIRAYNIPISKIMHRINTKYAKYYNAKKQRKGSPFEGRYRSILIQNESYILNLIKYVHNNPVYAGICSSMEEYKWSSDIFYRMNLDNLVDIDGLLDMFSIDRLVAIDKYKELMKEVPEDYLSLKYQYENENIIGINEFKESYKKQDKNVKAIGLDEILKNICSTEEDFKLIKNGSRKRYLTQYKYEYITEARKNGYTNIEIGKNIGISPRAIRLLLSLS